jgi:hypothetical protein
LYYGETFIDGFEPQTNPSPCTIPECTEPFPNIYLSWGYAGHPSDLDSQQVSLAGQHVILLGSSCTTNNVTGWANELTGFWGKADGSCSQPDEYIFIPSEATCSVDSIGRHCYSFTLMNGKQTCNYRDCPGKARIAQGNCMGWADSFPIEETKTCTQ